MPGDPQTWVATAGATGGYHHPLATCSEKLDNRDGYRPGGRRSTEPMAKCTSCSHENVAGARFCIACGARIGFEEAGLDPLVGQLVGGRYRVISVLGEGGMSRVYVAEQQLGSTVRKVAIKTLLSHLSNDAAILHRFHRECSTIAALEHPNTIKLFDFGATPDGSLYIAMELAAGEPLSEVLTTTGALLPERVVSIMRQVCGALDEAHLQGIVHRDLKPDNIILTTRTGEGDFAKVIDFGIALDTSGDQQKEAKLTQQGMVLGTPPYMSPEQFTAKKLDARSDIYSLGVIAYEMLVGKLPFEADSPWQWATQHLTVQPKPFEVSAPSRNIPFGMRRAVMKALAKDPEQRQSSTLDFLAELSSTSERDHSPGEPAKINPWPTRVEPVGSVEFPSVPRGLNAESRAPTQAAGSERVPRVEASKPPPAANPASHRVFISYAAEDDEYVRTVLAPRLEGAGIGVWWAGLLGGGTYFHRAIMQAIEQSVWVVAVVSPHTPNSTWVTSETQTALDLGKGVIPVIIGHPCDPGRCHMHFRLLHQIDLTKDRATALDDLVETLKAAPTRSRSASQEAVAVPKAAIDAEPGSRESARLVGDELERNPAQLGDVFRNLAHTDRRVQQSAAAFLERIEWSALLELLDACLQGGDEPSIEGVLKGLAAAEATPRSVELLDRTCAFLQGRALTEGMSLLEEKRLSLECEELSRAFQRDGSPYVLEGVLGAGAFTHTYSATHRGSKLRAVIRVLRPELAMRADARAHFIGISHRSMRYVHEKLALTRHVGALSERRTRLGDRSGVHYSVRDFVPGKTLQLALREGERFSLLQSLVVLRQVAEALIPIHDSKEGHAAVKPSNVFVLRGRAVKLGDPGMPLKLLPPSNPRFWQDLEYAAPEVLHADGANPIHDVYSLGCLTHELIHGSPPSSSRDAFAWGNQAIAARARRPMAVGPLPDAPEQELLDELLAWDPTDRLPNARAVLARVKPLIRRLQYDAERTVTILRPEAQSPPREDRSIIAVDFAARAPEE